MRFITDDFLLKGTIAQRLYLYAKDLPIIDYHCHIDPREIAEDIKFENITKAWLDRDHYKWTAMRSNGVDEKYITGDASDREKFLAYAQTLPECIGNPIHHWSHLELRTYFGYDGHLTDETAAEVWDLCNDQLQNGMSARQVMEQSNVKLICTTDDPVDSLEWHKMLRDDKSFSIIVLPAFRPDQLFNIGKDGFTDYISHLSDISKVNIDSIRALFTAVIRRMDFFGSMGCTVSDHALEKIVYMPATAEQVELIFQKALRGETLQRDECCKYITFILHFLAGEYTKRNWVMQIHFGVIRDINSRLYAQIGPDAGGDAMGGYTCMDKLALLLGDLDRSASLPKTILYSINPADNAAIDSLIGCFQTSEVNGKLQHGSAWWFNDTKNGIENHLIGLASQSVLGRFIGMLTDSRSFLSYTRHDYFRRILCNLLGELVDNGEYPDDFERLKKIVGNICYYNACEYFGLKSAIGE